MYTEIEALHSTLENENINHVFEEKYCEDTQLHYAVITFQEEIELFNGHMVKHNFPVWFMQVDGGKMYINNNNGTLEMEVTTKQGIEFTQLFKESGVI